METKREIVEVAVETGTKTTQVIEKPDGTKETKTEETYVIERGGSDTDTRSREESRPAAPKWLVGAETNFVGDYGVRVERRLIGTLSAGVYVRKNRDHFSAGLSVSLQF